MIHCDLLIQGGSIVTMDGEYRILEDHVLVIKDGQILDLCPQGQHHYSAQSIIDASSCLITPGFINAHTHMPMTYFRGLADDLPLDRWLQSYIWPLEAKMITPEFVHDASLHAAAEMLCNGITLANDMYFHMAEIADASVACGLRVIVSEAMIGTSVKTPLADLGSHVQAILHKYEGNPLVDACLAPHSIYTCSTEILAACAKVASQKGWMIHTHLSESLGERERCLQEHGLLPLEYLHSLGFTQERCVFAHGVWLTEPELDLMVDSDCSIALCTDSNLKLGSGFAPLAELHKRGIKVAFATDGVASNNNLDILEELSTTAKLHKVLNGDPEFLPARDAFAMLTIDAATALGKAEHLGSLEIGKAADLCVIDVDRLGSQPMYNPYSHLVYAIGAHQIRDVVIAGRLVVQDHVCIVQDQAALIDKAKYWKNKILSEMKL